MTKKRRFSTTAKDELVSRVSTLLGEAFGDCREEKTFIRGKVGKSPYRVDIHAWKKSGYHLEGWKIVPSVGHVWVEVRNNRVKRKHVEKLVESAKDIAAARKNGEAEWSPDTLIAASNVGFTDEAVELASKLGVYCLKVGKDSFNFVGKIKPQRRRKNILSQIKVFIISTIIFLVVVYVLIIFLK